MIRAPRALSRLLSRQGGLGLAVLLGLATMDLRLWGAVATPAETNAWEVAARFFQGAAYDLAERELQSFLQAYPESARAAEAQLLVGQCRFQQANYEGALATLRERLPGAGGLTDQYRFWVAESLFRLKRYEEAAQEYAAVHTGFPESSRRLDALVGEAYARHRAGRSREGYELLARPEGLFLASAPSRLKEDLVARGFLLIGEAALVCGEAAAAEQLLGRMPVTGTTVDQDWERQYLLARLQVAAQRLDAALQTTVVLAAQLAGSTNAGAVQFRADAAALQGQILEKQGDAAGALRAFEQNLVAGVPAGRRQEAASQVARLVMATQEGETAAAALETILAKMPGDPVLSPLRVAWAETLLRRYFGLTEEARAASGSLLLQARQLVGQALTNVVGLWAARAQFAAGWCGWEEGQRGGDTLRLTEALVAFEAAATGLERSMDQAVAWFKAGDCQSALTNYPAALANYWIAATNYADLPGIQTGVADHALYQVVRVATLLGEMAQADQAIQLVLQWHPDGSFGGLSVLAYGQALGQRGSTAEERRLYTDYLQRSTNAAPAAVLGLAVARTWQQEANWGAATAEYDRWIQANPNHRLRGRAEYERAWCVYRAGDEARAFTLYDEFLKRFPADEMAPRARYWVAGYYYGRKDYLKAEGEYQQVFLDTNAPVAVKAHARLMAGRSAYERTSYREAQTYFTELLNTDCPPDLRPEVLYELGNSIRMGATNELASLPLAIEVYNRIPALGPTNRWAQLAWMEIGKCQFQLAKTDPKMHDEALAAYTNVLGCAEVTLRSQAEVGMATVLEKMAATAAAVDRPGLLTEALRHSLNVTEGKNLQEGEQADLLWVERAANLAARLAEDMHRWDVAERLYLRLMELAPLPLVKQRYEAKLSRLRLLREKTEPER